VKLPDPPKPNAKPEVKLPEPPKPNAKPEVKLPEPPKPNVKPEVKLPEPPKPNVKPEVKLPEPPKPNAKQRKLTKQQTDTGKAGAKLNKNLKDKKSSSNKKQQVLKKSNSVKDKDKLVNAVKKPKTTTSKMIPKKKPDKSISYFIAPEKNIDNNVNPKHFMRRKPYNYDIKPPQYLLDIQKKGAKTNIPKFMFKDELSKLLFVAVNDQNIGAIKGLLLKGGNINAQNKANEYTPLMYAVENNRLDSLRYLILRGANLNIVTSNKMSALHLAAVTSNLKALRVLLSADSNVFIQDKYRKTFFDYVGPSYKNIVISDIFDTRKDANVALMDFCILGSLEGVKYSLQNKANINSQNHNGDTPLILAVRNNNPQLVTYLLSMGADETIKNNYKNDAKAVAKQNKYTKILDILETVKFNKHLHLLGVSDNIIPYKLSSEEKVQIEKNKKEIEHKDFDNYPSQGVLGTISKKAKK
jgi:ankyrin repeat protein